MRRTRTAFHVTLVLLSLALLAEALPAHAGPIDLRGVSRAVWGGADYQGVVFNFGPLESSSFGLFNETASGSGVTSQGQQVSGSAHQFSNVSLLDDVLTVDATMETNLKLLSLPQGYNTTGAALSVLDMAFTLHDWASYSATDHLLGDIDYPQEVFLARLSYPGDLEYLFHHSFQRNSEINDRHIGLLAPGTYGYRLISSVHVPPVLGALETSSIFKTSLVVTSVPEPSSLLLLACAGGLLVATRWTGWTQRAA